MSNHTSKIQLGVRQSFVSTDLIEESYRKSYGAWKVTTEGDVEGRTKKHLGTFEGHIDEIAKALADEAYYSLQFTRIGDHIQVPPPTKKKKVSCTLNIDSRTWDMSREERALVMREVLKDRPVSVSEGNYYASFVINFDEEE